jgi:hypothetical protein
MITVPVNKKTFLDLPDCWEDLTPEQTLATVRILVRLLAGAITPDRARLEMLVCYTGYRPSPRVSPETREIIAYNLMRLSQLLTFAFTVEARTLHLHFSFKRNPLPTLTVNRVPYPGKIFTLDITARTDITAREFVDAFDLLTAFHRLSGDLPRRTEALNQLCAILYPAAPEHRKNLVSGQHERMSRVPEDIKTLILFWFTGIVDYYIHHPVYAILFSSEKKESGSEKIHLGASETALYLTREGYGDPDRMTLSDYFDAQVKSLKDNIGHALAQGVKIESISRETGLSFELLHRLR